MRKSRCSDDQMAAIVLDADRTSVAETSRKQKVIDQGIYLWRNHFADMAPARGQTPAHSSH